MNEIAIFIEDRIQEISDELIKQLESRHSELSYEDVFGLYLFSLDEFLANFLEGGEDQLKLSQRIILNIFTALENERNSSMIAALTTKKMRLTAG